MNTPDTQTYKDDAISLHAHLLKREELKGTEIAWQCESMHTKKEHLKSFSNGFVPVAGNTSDKSLNTSVSASCDSSKKLNTSVPVTCSSLLNTAVPDTRNSSLHTSVPVTRNSPAKSLNTSVPVTRNSSEKSLNTSVPAMHNSPEKSLNTSVTVTRNPSEKSLNTSIPVTHNSSGKSLNTSGPAIQISSEKSLYTSGPPKQNSSEKSLNTSVPVTRNSSEKSLNTSVPAIHNWPEKSLNTSVTVTRNPSEKSLNTSIPVTHNSSGKWLNTLVPATHNLSEKSLNTSGPAIQILSEKSLNTSVPPIQNSSEKSLTTSVPDTHNWSEKSLNTSVPAINNSSEKSLDTSVPVIRNSSEKSLNTSVPVLCNSSEKSLNTSLPVTRNPSEKSLNTSIPVTHKSSGKLFSTMVPATKNSSEKTLNTSGPAIQISSEKSLNTSVPPIQNSSEKSLTTSVPDTHNSSEKSLNTSVPAIRNSSEKSLNTSVPVTHNPSKKLLNTTVPVTSHWSKKSFNLSVPDSRNLSTKALNISIPVTCNSSMKSLNTSKLVTRNSMENSNLRKETNEQDTFVHKNDSDKKENLQGEKDENNSNVQFGEESVGIEKRNKNKQRSRMNKSRKNRKSRKCQRKKIFLLKNASTVYFVLKVFLIEMIRLFCHYIKTNEHLETISKTFVPRWLLSGDFIKRSVIDVNAVPCGPDNTTLNRRNSLDILRSILQDQRRRHFHLQKEQFRLATFSLQRRSSDNFNTIELARNGFFCDLDGRLACFDCNFEYSQSRAARENHHPNCRAHGNTTETIADDYGARAQSLLVNETAVFEEDHLARDYSTQTEGGIQESAIQGAAASSEARASQPEPASRLYPSERCPIVTSIENSRQMQVAARLNRNVTDLSTFERYFSYLRSRRGLTYIPDSNSAEDIRHGEVVHHSNTAGDSRARNTTAEITSDENSLANDGNNQSNRDLGEHSSEQKRRNCATERPCTSESRQESANLVASRNTTATISHDISNNPSCRYPHYDSLVTRKESFKDSNFSVERRVQMAEAGLFYTGQGDITRCYKCGIGLRDWSPDDDPFDAHANHNPECPLAREHQNKKLSKMRNKKNKTNNKKKD